MAASKVQALCELKRTFMSLGVPEAKIGLKHSLNDASEPSTGNHSFPYQLVTHARVRGGGKDFELFGRHEGAPRAVLIYDETLFRSEVLGLDAVMLNSALGALGPLVDAAPESSLALAYRYLSGCSKAIQAALASLRERGDPAGQGAMLQLDPLKHLEIQGYAQAVRGARIPPSQAETLVDLLEISQESLRVLATAKNDGAIWVSEAVPPELRNVVILDASHPIRRLASMDPSVELVRSFEIDDLKSFENVEVVQLLSAGGRDSTEKAAKTIGRERSALSQEVTDLVRENWGTASGILIFTYKRKAVDIVDQLRQDLRQAGFDPSERGPTGRPRIQFLTWGEETSINGYEHCNVVIMAGVLHRSFLNIAAEIRGQKANLAVATSNDLITKTVESEIAHLIYQGASRGSCRRIDNGKALPMRLYVIDRHLGMQSLLAEVMPNAKWQTRKPRHLPASKAAGIVDDLAVRLLDYLKSLPQEIERVSSKVVKEALALRADEGSKKAFQRAVERVTRYREYGWDADGRSLVRINFAYYFGKDAEIGDTS